MSRYVIKNQETNRTLTYGCDHALGYFYDITDSSKNDDESGYLIEEKCYLLNRLSRNDFAKVLLEWNASEKHITSLALDLPF